MVMAGKKKPYRKLSGDMFALLFTNSLWQGDDHLLRAESGMMQERYWRFYFKDIQAVRLQRTRAHVYWALLWATLVVGWCLTLLIESFPSPVSLGFGFFFFLLLLINLLLGPSCQVHLQTAVQVQRLAGLRRVRKARKVMDRIREAVEQVQGPLDPGATWSEAPLASTTPMAGRLASHQPTGSRATDPSSGNGAAFTPWLHFVLFAALVAAAVFNGWHLLHPHVALVMITHGLLLGLLVWVIVTLVRNHEALKGRLLAKATWTAAVLIAVQCLAVYIIYILASVQKPQSAYDTWAILSAYIDLQLSDSPFRVGVTAVSAVIDLLIGAVGLLVLIIHKHPNDR
jgi:hypothetical protein